MLTRVKTAKGVPTLRPVLALLAAMVLVGGSVGTVTAASAGNDERETATAITSIPFSQALDTTGATSAVTDPGYCFAPEFGQDAATVWFRYSATQSGPLGATTFGSDYDTTLYVGTSDGAGGIESIACSDDVRTLQAAVRFDAIAGETYLFMVGASLFAGVNGGNLVFNLDLGPVAQAVDLTVDSRATVAKGVVTIQGSVSCSAPAELGSIVVAELSQPRGTREALGVGFLDVAGCPGGPMPFAIQVPSEVGKFKAGEATGQVIYAACNAFECGNETIDLVLSIEK